MQENVKAFFYEFKYYLMPEGCEELEDVRRLKLASVKRCKEEFCLAPDFVEESIVDEELVIERPEHVFPVLINLYTREEYDAALLKQIKNKCIGCYCFSDENDKTIDLNVRYEIEKHSYSEMSLSGICYGRIDGNGVTADFLLARFWEWCAEDADELRLLIRGGDEKMLNRFLNTRLEKLFLPLDFFAAEQDGKYCLCMSAGRYPYQGMRLIPWALKEAFDKLNIEELSDFVVYPYFKAELYRPVLRPDYAAHPPKMFFETIGEETKLTVYDKDADKRSDKSLALRKRAFYKYLCSEIGENVLLAGVEKIVFSSKPSAGEEVTAGDLKERLTKLAKSAYGGEIPFPAPMYLSAGGEVSEELPYKEETSAWKTVCSEMSPEKAWAEDSVAGLFEPLGIGYAYIFLPDSGLGVRRFYAEAVWKWYFENFIKYSDEEKAPAERWVFALPVGETYGKKGICFDYAVFDEGEFFRMVRSLAPVLHFLGAKLAVVHEGGTDVYDTGFTIKSENAEIYS